MTLLSIYSRRILYVALLAGLGGCAAWAPAPQRPPEPAPPAAWQAGSAPAIAAPVSSATAPWWQALQDPQLDALQVLALQANLETQSKALSWQIAMTQVRQASLAQQPSARLDLGTNTRRALQSGETSVVIDGVRVPLSNEASTSRSYGLSAGLSYEWDLWSKLAQAAQGERARAGIKHEDWRSARWLVSTKVAEAYWSIAAIDAKLPILTELSQAADEALRIAHLRLSEGKLRADEVADEVTKQYEARERLANARAERRLKLNELALLLDREPPALAQGEARLPPGEPAEPPLGTPAQTLERRPDVRQARLAVDAALAGLHVAEAARYPALRMDLGLQTNGSSWRDWFSQPLATLGLNLAVPLVDWRRLDAQRDSAGYTLGEAALKLRISVRQALVDVENALLERERWQQKWQAAQMQQAEKEKILKVARLRQEVGVLDRFDFLQSRAGVLEAQIKIIELRYEAWKNLLNLYKALGGEV